MNLKNSPPASALARAEQAIASRALSFPESVENNPWGHRAFKVRGKTFLFLGADAEGMSFSVKLPLSGEAALSLTFTEPTHYGLGKSGWVTAYFKPGDEIHLGLIEQWLEESYTAIAPKKLVQARAQQQQQPAAVTPQTPAVARKPKQVASAAPAKKKAASKKTAAKKQGAPAAAKKQTGTARKKTARAR